MAIEVAGLQVTHNYLSVLGVNPAIGRTFTMEDAVAAAASEEENAPDPVPTVVMTHGLWQRMFGEDPNLAGRTINIRGFPVQVIGVLPRDFQLLHERRYRSTSGTGVELFFVVPEAFFSSGRPAGPQPRIAFQIGRLREGITYERAQASLDALAARYRAEVPSYGNDELTLPLV